LLRLRRSKAVDGRGAAMPRFIEVLKAALGRKAGLLYRIAG